MLLAGCQPQYGPRKTSLRLRGGEPADAMVIVDDQPIAPLGVVARRGMAVLRGRHRITVQRTGYFPWDRVVEADDDMIYLDVSLQKLPELSLRMARPPGPTCESTPDAWRRVTTKARKLAFCPAA